MAHGSRGVFGYPSPGPGRMTRPKTRCVESAPFRLVVPMRPAATIDTHPARCHVAHGHAPVTGAIRDKRQASRPSVILVQVTIPRECPMKAANQSRSRLAASVALLFSVSIAAPVLAQSAVARAETPVHAEAGRVIQDDPDNPIKFSIDPAIADGSVSTSDLYIGTVGSYLGSRADGKTPVF